MARVLLVDDNDMVRQVMRAGLVKHHEVLEAQEGQTAVELLRHEPVDIVVLDMHMPGWTGTQTAAAIASEHPEMKMIFLSGSMDAQELAESGVAVLLKPIRPRQLVAAIEEALASGRGT